MSQPNYLLQHGHGRPARGPQQQGYPRQAPGRPVPPQQGYVVITCSGGLG